MKRVLIVMAMLVAGCHVRTKATVQFKQGGGAIVAYPDGHVKSFEKGQRVAVELGP